jgi:hypothetical protein
VTYPNVLVLDYLKSTDQATPELQMQSEEYIAQGYQRLLTFEVPGGGFSLFGQAPAQPMLTAYGLMEFSDMSRVHYVDPALIHRTGEWLISQQQGDGSWPVEGMTIESGLESVMTTPLPVTAYTIWALAEAGFDDTMALTRGLDYLRAHQSDTKEPYVLALLANAFAAVNPSGSETLALLATLEGMKSVDGDRVFWSSGVKSFMGGADEVANIETTALVAYAMLKTGAYADTVNGALNYIVAHTDSFGAWQTTQATILSLRALLLAATGAGAQGQEATVQVFFNGEETDAIHITDANADVVHLVSFTDKARPGENYLDLAVEGQRPLMYQVIAEYYLPWDKAPEEAEQAAMAIEVGYDRTELAVNDVVTARAWIKLLQEGVARMALVDLGIPPGFSVLSEDLDELVERGVISRYELAGRQIIVYLENFSSEQALEFAYRLRANYPIKAKTPGSTVYDYYTPSTRGLQRPVVMVVNE